MGLETTTAPTEEKIKEWEQAYLGRHSYRGDVFVASLALHRDPASRIYAYLRNSFLGDRVSADIPLIDHSPISRLVENAYLGLTLFGEIDPEQYRAFATNEFNCDPLLVFLNREKAGVAPDDTTKWFYKTFGLEHQRRYGSVYVGSHGGMLMDGLRFNVTIMRRSTIEAKEEDATRSVAAFAQVVEGSLPHISVNPMPVETYLQELQSALKFLPRDW